MPGGLNLELMLHSNRPERIESPGLLLSTLPDADGTGGPWLASPLKGAFRLFLHHIARTAILDPGTIWIGLIAHQRGKAPLRLVLRAGSSHLTRPDAPFLALPTLTDNAKGQIWSGPSDRVALERLRGEGNLAPAEWTLSPGTDTLLYAWPLLSNPFPLWQQDMALSGLLDFEASDEVHLSLVAVLQPGSPRLNDFLKASSQAAGPAEPDATPYEPGSLPSSGDFRYGRVAGLARGSRWDGELNLDLADLLAKGQLGYPIASPLLKRLGAEQVQSAPLLARAPGSAYAAHGNYGVHYRLALKLHNPSAQALTLSLALRQPLSVSESQGQMAHYQTPPGEAIRFRGSLHHDFGPKSQGWTHLSLRKGEQAQSFARILVPPGAQQAGVVEWIYPADATPPQLFCLEALP